MIKVIQKQKQINNIMGCNQSSMSILETSKSHLRSVKFKSDYIYKTITINFLTFYNILCMIGPRLYVWFTHLFKANLYNMNSEKCETH